MPKHKRRRDRNAIPGEQDQQSLPEKLEQIAQDAAMHFPAPQPPPPPNPQWPNLAKVRNAALDARTDAQRTILELEAWRDELDATLAFLRAHRR